MDSNLASSPSEDTENRAEFRKPSNDSSQRRYRRHSPSSGSSSDGSPKNEHSSTPPLTKGYSGKVFDSKSRRKDDERELRRESRRDQSTRTGDAHRYHDRSSSRASYRNDYTRYDRHNHDEDNRHSNSSRHGRQSKRSIHLDREAESNDPMKFRDQSRGSNKESYERYDGQKQRDNIKDKSPLESRKYNGMKEMSPPRRDGSSRKPKISCCDDAEAIGREKNDRDVRNDRRNFSDHKSDRTDSSRDYLREGRKDYDNKNPNADIRSQDSLYKKPKLFESSNDAEGSINDDELQYSNSKRSEKIVCNDGGQSHTDVAEMHNNLNAAKVAAMKAAELVNKNLVGVGTMSTDQKKKLLWGSKKSTATEESGPKWNTAMFDDPERQEKFNKLMSLRLPWYLWPIVGCEGRRKDGQFRQGGQRCSTGGREAERSSDRSGKAIYRRSSSSRWPNCWTGTLRTFVVPSLHNVLVLSCRTKSIFCVCNSRSAVKTTPDKQKHVVFLRLPNQNLLVPNNIGGINSTIKS